MKTTQGKRPPALRGCPQLRGVPSLRSGMQEQILLDNKRGWKSTKTRPKVKCFLLTSPLIEHCRHLESSGRWLLERVSAQKGQESLLRRTWFHDAGTMHDPVGPSRDRLVEVAVALRRNGLAIIDGAKQLKVVVGNGNGDGEANHLLDLVGSN